MYEQWRDNTIAYNIKSDVQFGEAWKFRDVFLFVFIIRTAFMLLTVPAQLAEPPDADPHVRCLAQATASLCLLERLSFVETAGKHLELIGRGIATLF